jgi:ribosomal peptide maturation radical SAM protein 1
MLATIVAMRPKPVALVSMPTLSGHFPCFQLGLLKPTLERAGYPVEPFSLYLHFGGLVGWPLHEALAEVRPSLVGEWIWAPHAFGSFAQDADYLEIYRDNLQDLCESAGCTLDTLLEVRAKRTGEFLRWCMERIDWSRYGLVGFTVLFQQQLASLALAKEIKKRHPEIPIVLGGGTFEDDIAHEILRNCPQVDFVHVGEGDATFPELVRRLYAGESMAGLPGVLWRNGERIEYAGRAPDYLDMDATPTPDFDEYFRAREESGYSQWPGAEAVMLPIETARGCWWGAKSQCTFCGLNRTGLRFRARSPENALEMLEELALRYDVFSFNAVDNIMEPAYVEKLFGVLAEAHSDLDLHYDVKANLRRHQLARMKAGGLRSVQSGVESLSTHVLKLMRKGVTAVRNLELIKWCTYYDIHNLWIILMGFEGETAEDYRRQCDLVAKIFHLQPPCAITRARPDRGSPMFANLVERGTQLEPQACYRFLFPPDRFDLPRVAYYYELPRTTTLPEAEHEALRSLVTEWQERWQTGRPRPFLRYRKVLDSLTILDGRTDEFRRFRLNGREARLYEYCADAHGLSEIQRRFGGPASWIDQALEEMLHLDLMVFLDERYLSLALPENPHHGMAALSPRDSGPPAGLELAP